jgi:hypothetical protein
MLNHLRYSGLGPVSSPPPEALTVTPLMLTVSGSSLPARLSRTRTYYQRVPVTKTNQMTHRTIR